MNGSYILRGPSLDLGSLAVFDPRFHKTSRRIMAGRVCLGRFQCILQSIGMDQLSTSAFTNLLNCFVRVKDQICVNCCVENVGIGIHERRISVWDRTRKEMTFTVRTFHPNHDPWVLGMLCISMIPIIVQMGQGLIRFAASSVLDAYLIPFVFVTLEIGTLVASMLPFGSVGIFAHALHPRNGVSNGHNRKQIILDNGFGLLRRMLLPILLLCMFAPWNLPSHPMLFSGSIDPKQLHTFENLTILFEQGGDQIGTR
mmetsp:Transcript_22489/g.46860  ORF Transcript_22489/g.46860 Transcript_22489/m.46860 type:complete len:256 (+) Transcript_22489:1199-1966(+)